MKAIVMSMVMANVTAKVIVTLRVRDSDGDRDVLAEVEAPRVVGMEETTTATTTARRRCRRCTRGRFRRQYVW